MATVFVTGAHGFIGKHLARELAARSHRVAGLGHGIWPEHEALAWGVGHWLNGDITPGNLQRLLKTCGAPDAVFHLAGGSSVGAAVAQPREDFFRTVASTAELLDWLRSEAPACAVVAISSAAVYGAGHDGPIAETAVLNPFSPYGHHKRMMEELCCSHAASYGQRCAVARLFSVYGPGLKKQLLWDIGMRLARGEAELTLGGCGDELRDWTDVRDVVRALAGLPAAASAEVPVLNVGSGQGTSVREIAQRMTALWSAAAGRPPARVVFNGHSRPGDPFSLVADAARLRATGFGWQIPLQQGLADVVTWLRSQERDAN
jgi:UDP-glucose 4-epimerase